MVVGMINTYMEEYPTVQFDEIILNWSWIRRSTKNLGYGMYVSILLR